MLSHDKKEEKTLLSFATICLFEECALNLESNFDIEVEISKGVPDLSDVFLSLQDTLSSLLFSDKPLVLERFFT